MLQSSWMFEGSLYKILAGALWLTNQARFELSEPPATLPTRNSPQNCLLDPGEDKPVVSIPKASSLLGFVALALPPYRGPPERRGGLRP